MPIAVPHIVHRRGQIGSLIVQFRRARYQIEGHPPHELDSRDGQRRKAVAAAKLAGRASKAPSKEIHAPCGQLRQSARVRAARSRESEAEGRHLWTRQHAAKHERSNRYGQVQFLMEYEDGAPHSRVAHDHVRSPLSEHRLQVFHLTRHRPQQPVMQRGTKLQKPHPPHGAVGAREHELEDLLLVHIAQRETVKSFVINESTDSCPRVERDQVAPLPQHMGDGEARENVARKRPHREQESGHRTHPPPDCCAVRVTRRTA